MFNYLIDFSVENINMNINVYTYPPAPLGATRLLRSSFRFLSFLMVLESRCLNELGMLSRCLNELEVYSYWLPVLLVLLIGPREQGRLPSLGHVLSTPGGPLNIIKNRQNVDLLPIPPFGAPRTPK